MTTGPAGALATARPNCSPVRPSVRPLPQGVLLTHRAVASEVASLHSWLASIGHGDGRGEVYLSFLPLAHIYGR